MLALKIRSQLEDFLIAQSNVFAWSHEHMPRVDPEVIGHRLSVDLSHKLVRQKRRSFNLKKYKAIKDEVEKLLKTGFIGECYYPSLLANIMMVKK